MARNDFVINLGDRESEEQDAEISINEDKIPKIEVEKTDDEDHVVEAKPIDQQTVDTPAYQAMSKDHLVVDTSEPDEDTSEPDEDPQANQSPEQQTGDIQVQAPVSSRSRVAGIKISFDGDELESEDNTDDFSEEEKKRKLVLEKKRKLEEEAKKQVRSNIMTEMAEKGLSMSEDVDPSEVKLEIFNEANKKRKQKAMLMKSLMGLLVVGLIGTGSYFGYTNKDKLASILKNAEVVEKIIYKTGEVQTKIVYKTGEIQTKIVTQIVDKLDDKVEELKKSGFYYLIPKDTFKQIGIEDFYAVYLYDFDYVNNLDIPEDIKKQLFEKVNIAVHQIENGSLDYHEFRIKYNQYVNKVLSIAY